MRQVFETIDNEDVKIRKSFRESNRNKDKKYTIEDIHYVMMYHVHI